MNANKTTFIDRIPSQIRSLKSLVKNKLARVEPDFSGIVLPKYKAIYVPIPKVACSSLKKVFAELLNINVSSQSHGFDDVHRAKFRYVKGNQIIEYKDYWKFALVRNPFDRIVSCYKEKIKDDENFSGTTNSFVNGVHKGLLKYGVFKAKMTFEEFVNAVAEISDAEADPHFKSEYTFIADKKGELLVNFVGKLENFQEDFDSVCKNLEIENITIPHLNKTAHKNYRNYYTDELKNIVAKRYSKDIEMFEYNF